MEADQVKVVDTEIKFKFVKNKIRINVKIRNKLDIENSNDHYQGQRQSSGQKYKRRFNQSKYYHCGLSNHLIRQRADTKNLLSAVCKYFGQHEHDNELPCL